MHKPCQVFIGPALAQRQYLFRDLRHNLTPKVQDISDTQINRHGIPRRADTESINMFAGEAFHHVRWRQHNEAHVLVRIHATRGHPETELIIVIGEGERHSEGERLETALFPLRNTRQCSR